MSRLVARILLSILLFPLATVIYITAIVCGESALLGSASYATRQSVMFLIADGAAGAFVAVYWLLLWRTVVRWTASRITGTVVAAVGALAIEAVVGLVAFQMARSAEGFGVFLGGVLGILLWLGATIVLWRETAAERADRVTGTAAVTCPTCGYNLTGLDAARCPECGSRFTLDELLAQQPARAGGGELD